MRVLPAHGGHRHIGRLQCDAERGRLGGHLAAVRAAAVRRCQPRQTHDALVDAAAERWVAAAVADAAGQVHAGHRKGHDVRLPVGRVPEELLLIFVPFHGVQLFAVHVEAASERQFVPWIRQRWYR